MSNLRKHWPPIIFLFVLGVFGGLHVFGPSETEAASGPEVTVTNTPLPVSISDTPNVTITGTPTVGIDALNNTVNVLREPENPARQPFQVRFDCVFTDNNSCLDNTSVNVPSGKILVIEYLSLNVQGPTGTTGGIITLDVRQATGSNVHYFPVSPTWDDGVFANFVTSQQTRLYADPSTNVRVRCVLSGPSNSACIGTVAGYLVDVL